MADAPDSVEAVREMALRCLDRRAYGTAELKARLLSKGADEQVVDDVLGRLTGVGLLDDAKYAASLVEQRHEIRHQSRRATTIEMQRRGLSPDVVQQATQQIDDADDLESARLIAAARMPHLAGLERPVAWRRLSGALARKGYSPSVVSVVVRESLRGPDDTDL